MINKPFTLNVLYANEEAGIVETLAYTFSHKVQAIAAAREEVKWENTVHATVTHEPTSEDVFDAPGDFNYLRT
jgi:hypothetical protein